jgi:hypothetical protein
MPEASRTETSRPEQSRVLRCGIYTRKSTAEGLEQEFNSLDAQRESAEAYIASQRHAGWTALAERYEHALRLAERQELRLVPNVDHAEVVVLDRVGVARSRPRRAGTPAGSAL